jgi:hypothetical protein
MVNFRDPNTIVRESGACAPQTFFFKSEGNWTHLPDKVDRFWNLVNGIFICVSGSYWRLAISMCHITQFSLAGLACTPTGSWEFLNTLDYEWNVIRGRRPYRWTIWVLTILPSFCPAKFQLATI